MVLAGITALVVYIGKADDSAKSRLEKHRRQLQE